MMGEGIQHEDTKDTKTDEENLFLFFVLFVSSYLDSSVK